MAPKPTITPGIALPINRPPTDIPVTDAINTAGILGGIIGPWSAEAAVTAVLNSLSYPCLVIISISKGPSAATSARAEPVNPPNSILAKTFA
ncbi:hypothetical protein ES705_23293 [subsurface metagenome]